MDLIAWWCAVSWVLAFAFCIMATVANWRRHSLRRRSVEHMVRSVEAEMAAMRRKAPTYHIDRQATPAEIEALR